jgi:dTDP-4-amino-4,6-dideoxygalactose transaminase
VHTFTATAEVVCYLGATPVFVDVRPGTLTIDPELVEVALGPNTRAIMPVHYAGLACDMAPLMYLARRHGLAVIDDAAHAFPTTYCGGLIGALNVTATVFSFYATKTIATGEGGMIVTRSPELAERTRVMRLHGINRDVFDRYQGSGSSWRYEVIAPGYKYNLTDIAAALGLHQLRRAYEMRDRRAKIAAAYDAGFSTLPLELPRQPLPGDQHSWHLYPVQVTAGSPLDRDSLVTALKREGIGTSVHYIPLHMHRYWRERYNLCPERFPVSTAAYAGLLSLPIYSKMSDAEVEQVIRVVRRLLG